MTLQANTTTNALGASLETRINDMIESENIVQITGVVSRFLRAPRKGLPATYFSADGIRAQYYSLLGKSDGFNIFKELLERKGRCYPRVVSSFSNRDTEAFNILTQESWVRPMDGAHHPAFDALLASIGNGKPENIEYLERIIAWKYAHPDSPMLPATVMYGEGGTGKNVLVDRVLNTIFGGQTNSFLGSHAHETFNSDIVGKTVVLLNECERDKVSMAQLKQYVGQQSYRVNEKYVPSYTAESTQLWLLASNDPDGAITLAGDYSDRRWSIIRCGTNKPLSYWLNSLLNLGYDDHREVKIQPYVDDYYSNPDECAKWLHHILEKHRGQEMPQALHGEDYRNLLDDQKSVFNRVCEEIFLDPDFIAIPFDRFYGLYEVEARADNTNSKFIKTRKTIKSSVNSWLARYAPHIVARFSKSSYSPENRVFLRDDRISPSKTRESAWINTEAVPADIASIHIGLDGQLVEKSLASIAPSQQQAANSPLYLISSNQ